MPFRDARRRQLFDHYDTIIRPALDGFGFESDADVVSDRLGHLDSIHYLRRVERLKDTQGLLRGQALSYGDLLEAPLERGDGAAYSYRIMVTATIVGSYHKGTFQVLVQNTDHDKFGTNGKFILQAVAPVSYLDRANLLALLIRAFTSIEEVEQNGDVDTLWLVALLGQYAESSQRLMCGLPYLYPTRSKTEKWLAREAHDYFKNGYAI